MHSTQSKSLLSRGETTTTTDNKTSPVDSCDELRRSVISRPEKRLRKYDNSNNDDCDVLLSQVTTLLSNQQVRAPIINNDGFGDFGDLNIFLHTLKQERDEQDYFSNRSLNSCRCSTSSEV